MKIVFLRTLRATENFQNFYFAKYFHKNLFHQIMSVLNSFSGKGRTSITNGGGLAPSRQNVGSLLRTPRLAKPVKKLDSTNSQFDKVGYHPMFVER